MKFGKAFLSSALLLSASLPCLASTHARRGPTSPKLFNKRSKSATKPAAQRGIDDTRATPAMQKFQSDNGWQTKLIPDSRAIIKLGLGPAHDSGQSTSAAASPASDVMPK